MSCPGHLTAVLEGTARWTLSHGRLQDVLPTLPAHSVDAIVTDPPYGLGEQPDMEAVLRAWLAGDAYQPKGAGFMGKEWDAFVPGPEVWREAYRVLKPGGHLLAFFGTRTFDLGTLALRLAGFEVRDVLSWLYGTGFPKSKDVSKALDELAGAQRAEDGSAKRQDGGRVAFSSGVAALRCGRCGKSRNGTSCRCPLPGAVTDLARQWEGWGTAVKPAWEPVVLARKPLVGTVAANIMAHGTGALNINACRIPYADAADLDAARVPQPAFHSAAGSVESMLGIGGRDGTIFDPTKGRWPANVVLDEEAAAALDEQTGVLTSGGGPDQPLRRSSMKFRSTYSPMRGQEVEGATYGDSGGASRFFYVAKAPRAERDAGCESLPARSGAEATDSEEGQARLSSPRTGAGRTGGARNIHPTVKPVELMRWLVRLVTPKGGVVLDPFAGSGSTGVAALLEGQRFIGVEQSEEYAQIARLRLAHGVHQAERQPKRQASLFDEEVLP